MIKGILFDMDGVLLDSEEFICQAAVSYFRSRGVAVSAEDFVPFVGAGENRYLGGVAEKYDVVIENITEAKKLTYAIYAELVQGKLRPMEGVVEFVRGCRERGLKTAVATSADLTKMEINLHEINLDHGEFDTLVNGLDVEHKKPSPDIYQLAAGRLGLDPTECVVCEDAPNGIQAAKAAGARCIAVTSSFSAEHLRMFNPDLIISGFPDILDFRFL